MSSLQEVMFSETVFGLTQAPASVRVAVPQVCFIGAGIFADACSR